MNASTHKVIMVESGAVLVLTVAIFILDVLTPLGWADWLLYFIPLVVMLQSPRERDPYYFAALATLLTAVGGYLSPSDIHPWVALFNRFLGMLVMWAFTWLMVRQKRAQAFLVGAEAARLQAETRREAAVAARELAESSLTGALHRESQAARELLLSSLRLEGIIQSAMDAILTVDEKQQVLLFNQAAEQMFRCPAREAIGQSIERFIPARFREGHHGHVRDFAQSGVTSRRMGALGIIRGLRANGEEFPVEAAISQISIEGKRFYTVVLRDITERKRAEELLMQSEERYRRLVEVSPVAIFVHRGEKIVFANQEGLALLGATSPEQVVGRSPFDFIHPEHVEGVKHRTRRIVHDGEQVIPAEERFIRVDGSVVDVEVVAARFVDQEGVGIEVVVRDVSERIQMQEQLKKAERLAELGTVASGMAHEIGTPMNVILGRAEYLMDRVKEEPIKKGLQTIVTQVERITKVMNQLLSFARRQAPERRPLDLKAVVENSIEIFQERLARNRIQVELRLDEQCPPVLADADQMSQVLINLIMNAVHAMPDGGALRVGMERANDMVMLTVADTGHGIFPEVVKKIFEPFFTTKEFGKGTGLGLTVVKGIIEEHQGSIAVESEPEKGTTFTVLLPRSP